MRTTYFLLGLILGSLATGDGIIGHLNKWDKPHEFILMLMFIIGLPIVAGLCMAEDREDRERRIN